MDPASLAIILHNLIPIVAVLSVFGLPVGIVWTVKNHQVRMKELELEGRHLPPPLEQRIAQLEAKLSTIEQALTGGAQQPSSELMQAPPDSQRNRTR